QQAIAKHWKPNNSSSFDPISLELYSDDNNPEDNIGWINNFLEQNAEVNLFKLLQMNTQNLEANTSNHP
ncbi:2961_t:CDS:1, partial [Ambispora gerdemannii]